MANQRHVNILARDGVRVWNLWRQENPDILPDLSGANFRGADLSRVDLSRVDLSGVDFRGAYLIEADLREAYLIEANLSGAKLSQASLGLADLTFADLRGAKLSGADLRGVDLSGADLSMANLSRTNLGGANLSRAICLETSFFGATLTGCIVYGISAWNLNLESAVQTDVRITPRWEESAIAVDNLEMAQFLYLLLHNQKVRTLLDTITSKVVLILGRFSEERKPILDALREALRRDPNGYIPVLFDFEPQPNKPVFETMKTLANLARFVIADLTDPNMVRSELTYITANLPTVPVASVIQRGANLPTEYGTWTRYRSFLPVYRYDDLPHLLTNLTEAVIAPVEGHVVARRLAGADSA